MVTLVFISHRITHHAQIYQVGDKVNATSMPSNNLPAEDDHAIILEFSCCVQCNLTSPFAARKKT